MELDLASPMRSSMAIGAVKTKRSFEAINGDGIVCSSDSASSSITHGASKRHRVGSDETCTRIPRPMSAPQAETREVRHSFDTSASIVLVGIRGTGKSTLAVLASTATRRPVIEVDRAFQDATGLSPAAHRKQHSPANHNRRQEEVLRSVLATHDKGFIIVCNGSSVERSGQLLLQEYAKNHPVIHILREPRSIQLYLKAWEEPKIHDLLNISGDLFRRIANFEFYNLSETQAALRIPQAGQDSTPLFLTLKRAERNFLKFLALVTNGSHPQNDIQGNIRRLEPGCPLSDIAIELRKYTYTVQVPFPTLLSEDADIEEMEFGADAFEILVDPAESGPISGLRVEGIDPERAAHIAKAVSKVRSIVILPIIYHVTPSQQNSSLPSYLEHVRHGLRLAVDMLTVDLSLGVDTLNGIVDNRGSTKIIGHLQLSEGWEEPVWAKKYMEAKRLGCVAVRFISSASSAVDDTAAHIFKKQIELSSESLPLSAFNTGWSGRTSACFNPVLTSVVAESRKAKPDFAEQAEKNPYLPLITARDATNALYASFMLDPMQFYIIGANTGYSLSPAMYKAGYQIYSMPHSFRTMQTQTLNSLKALVSDPYFGGSAVTLPFKIEVISLTHSLSRHARAIGAVNTLIPVRHLKEDGSIPGDLELIHERNRAGPVQALYGENTDWIGIRACIRRGLSPANAVRPNTSGLVIGAGGMARAAVYAMLQSNVTNIAIFNRTFSNAEKLVAHFKRVISSSSDSGLLPSITSHGREPVFRILTSRDETWPQDFRFPTIIVSCIPPHPVNGPAPEFTLPTDWLKSPTGGVVIELEYRTLMTPLMRQIQAEAYRAWVYLDGLDLLPEQGFAQFELFTGRRAPRRLMREAVLKSWKDERGRSDPSMLRRRLEIIGDDEA